MPLTDAEISDFKRQLKEHGIVLKDSKWKESNGYLKGTFAPPIDLQETYETEEIIVSSETFPLFLMGRQEFGLPGNGRKLGVAFYVTQGAQGPAVVNAFIVRDGTLHIDTDPTVTATFEGGVLKLPSFAFTSRVGSQSHEATGDLEVTLS